jgi:hypothetical protein
VLGTYLEDQMRIVSTIVAVLLSLLYAAFCGGCERTEASGPSPAPAAALQPAPGTEVIVHFRRDALGALRDVPIPVSTHEFNESKVCVRGALRSMDEEWIVLERERGGDAWVPRGAILYLEVFGKPKS